MDSSIIILSQEQRKELTTIPENISDYVMAKYYTLSEEDIYHIQTHRRDTNKLGFAIQLCCIKYPGWGFTSTKDIPEKVLNYVSKQLGISPINIHSYGERKNTRTKHILKYIAMKGEFPEFNNKLERKENKAIKDYDYVTNFIQKAPVRSLLLLPHSPRLRWEGQKEGVV